MKILLSLMLCLLLSGCATYVARTDGIGEPFVATQMDCAFWWVFCIPNSDSRYFSNVCDYNNASQYIVTPLITSFVLMDLPFSIVTDIVMFPVDLIE